MDLSILKLRRRVGSFSSFSGPSWSSVAITSQSLWREQSDFEPTQLSKASHVHHGSLLRSSHGRFGKFGNLEIHKFVIQDNAKLKITKIKIHVDQNVGKVWIIRENNLPAPFSFISKKPNFQSSEKPKRPMPQIPTNTKTKK